MSDAPRISVSDDPTVGVLATPRTSEKDAPEKGASVRRGITVLVCGGRDYPFAQKVFEALDGVHGARHISLLIEGGAFGADRHGRGWAATEGIAFKTFHADWNAHGRAAGPIRNRRMLAEGKPDLVVAFPGGRGTADMVSAARAAGVEVIEVR
jgi:hypothetical protein